MTKEKKESGCSHRLALGSGAKDSGHVRLALNIGLLGKVEIAAVGLRLSSKGSLEIAVGGAALERGHGPAARRANNNR